MTTVVSAETLATQAMQARNAYIDRMVSGLNVYEINALFTQVKVVSPVTRIANRLVSQGEAITWVKDFQTRTTSQFFNYMNPSAQYMYTRLLNELTPESWWYIFEYLGLWGWLNTAMSSPITTLFALKTPDVMYCYLSAYIGRIGAMLEVIGKVPVTAQVLAIVKEKAPGFYWFIAGSPAITPEEAVKMRSEIQPGGSYIQNGAHTVYYKQIYSHLNQSGLIYAGNLDTLEYQYLKISTATVRTEFSYGTLGNFVLPYVAKIGNYFGVDPATWTSGITETETANIQKQTEAIKNATSAMNEITALNKELKPSTAGRNLAGAGIIATVVTALLITQ